MLHAYVVHVHALGHRSKDHHFPSVAFSNRELQVLHFLIHISIMPSSGICIIWRVLDFIRIRCSPSRLYICRPTLVWLIHSIHYSVYQRVTTHLRRSRAVFEEDSLLDIGLPSHAHAFSSMKLSDTIHCWAYPSHCISRDSTFILYLPIR